MGLINFKSILIIFHRGLDTIFTTPIFQTGHLALEGPFFFPPIPENTATTIFSPEKNDNI